MSDDFEWSGILARLLEKKDLTIAQAAWAMNSFMVAEAEDAHIAAFLVALAAKGESINELVGFRDAILEHAQKLDVSQNALDIVGTGGDKFGTVNVSTMASIVVAASGIPVIKHGNSAVSSRSGSADVLAQLGVNLEVTPQRLAEIFEEVGITFVQANKFHLGFKNVAHVRAQLGIPTIFNSMGPLVNPARPEASAVGVADAAKIHLVVGVFQTRGANALVFRGDEGLDELSTVGHSHVWEIRRANVAEHDLDPRELGIRRARLSDLIGGDAVENAARARSVFDAEPGPVRDIVLLNAAAGRVAFNMAFDPTASEASFLERLAKELEVVAQALDSGKAKQKLDQWAASSIA